MFILPIVRYPKNGLLLAHKTLDLYSLLFFTLTEFISTWEQFLRWGTNQKKHHILYISWYSIEGSRNMLKRTFIIVWFVVLLPKQQQ